jgi:hypothetical protein
MVNYQTRGKRPGRGAITSFRRLPKPVIAAVNGPAAGAGFSLVLAADIRIAGPAARFSAAFIKIGLTGGDCGSSWMLPRIVGLGHAYEILLRRHPGHDRGLDGLPGEAPAGVHGPLRRVLVSGARQLPARALN